MTPTASTKARAAPRASHAQRPQAKTAERREAILQAAMSVFGSRGYANGSLAEIAQQAGMTHPGVLHHFGTKEQLLIALLEYRDDADVEGLEGHLAPSGSPFLDHLVATTQENTLRPGIVQTYTVLAGDSVTEDHPAQEFFRDRLAGLRSMVEAAIEDRVEGTTIPVASAAAAIVAVMDGLQIQWLLEPDAIDMPGVVELTIDSLVEYMISRPA